MKTPEDIINDYLDLIFNLNTRSFHQPNRCSRGFFDGARDALIEKYRKDKEEHDEYLSSI